MQTNYLAIIDRLLEKMGYGLCKYKVNYRNRHKRRKTKKTVISAKN